jgi:hypothetical protein
MENGHFPKPRNKHISTHPNILPQKLHWVTKYKNVVKERERIFLFKKKKLLPKENIILRAPGSIY